jgi:hypothetical protein
MADTIATLVYTLQQQAGATLAALEAAMASPPVPVDLLAEIGVRLVSDTTAGALGVVTRTIVLALGPIDLAAATAVMSGDGEFLESVTLTAAGRGYAALPLVRTNPGHSSPSLPNGATHLTDAVLQATMELSGSTIVSGGTGFTAPTVYLRGGLQLPEVNNDGTLSAPSCVQALQLVAGGTGYSSNAVVEFLVDGLAPGAVLPTASLSITNGVVTGVLLTSTGSGLISAPEIVINDPGPASLGEGGGTGVVIAYQLGLGTAGTFTPTVAGGVITALTPGVRGGPYVKMPDVQAVDATGSGAVIVPLMRLQAINVVGTGSGWDGVPFIAITDLFTNLYQSPPPSSVHHAPPAGPFWNLMKVAIETAVGSPIVAAAPALT